MRIVSLLPSATDIVSALGAADELVGVSHSCGEAFAHLPRLTSTTIDLEQSSAEIDRQVKSSAGPLYLLDVERLEKLAPDVVVSQSLCDVCAVSSGDVEVAVREIASRPTLINLSPFRLHDVPQGFADVGEAIERPRQASVLKDRWRRVLDDHRGLFSGAELRVAVLDWLNPPFAAGHWIPDMIELLGAHSVLARPGEPSREISWDLVNEAEADHVFAACCGFDSERAARDVPANLEDRIEILDGYQLFSRPSPALLESLAVLAKAIQSSLDERRAS